MKSYSPTSAFLNPHSAGERDSEGGDVGLVGEGLLGLGLGGEFIPGHRMKAAAPKHACTGCT